MKNMRRISIMAMLVGLAGMTQPLFAHEEGACRDDVKKLCGEVKPGGGSIADCLKTHQADLSQGCKDNMAEGKQKFEEKKKEVMQACQADLKQFCTNVTPGEGREFACLRAYDDKISAGCKEKLSHPMMGKHMDMHHGDKDKGDQDDQSSSPAPAK